MKYGVKLEEICQHVIDQRNVFLSGGYKIFNGRSFYFYLYANTKTISITAANDQTISLQVYAFGFGFVPIQILDQRFDKSCILNMEEFNLDNVHGFLMQITFWNNKSPLLDVNILIE